MTMQSSQLKESERRFARMFRRVHIKKKNESINPGEFHLENRKLWVDWWCMIKWHDLFRWIKSEWIYKYLRILHFYDFSIVCIEQFSQNSRNPNVSEFSNGIKKNINWKEEMIFTSSFRGRIGAIRSNSERFKMH